MALRDLLVSFGVEVTGKKDLDEVDTSLSQLTDRANLLIKTLAGLQIIKEATSFVTGVVEMGAKVYDTANKLGVGTDELQAFEYAAKLVGVTSDQAARSLQYLERSMGNQEMGAKGAGKEFAKLGVQTKDAAGNTKPMAEMLPEIADAFSKLKSEPEQVAFAMKIFGRSGAGMVPILKQGSDGLRKVYDEFERLGGGLRKDFLDAAKEADKGMTRLSMGIDMAKSRIVLGLLPAFQWLLDKGLAVAAWFGSLADRTYGARTAFIALGVIVTAVMAPMLLSILPIVAAVGALYLAFDDLFTLFTDADAETMIGDFIDSLFGEGTAQEWVKEVKAGFEDFKEMLVTDFLPWLIVVKDILKDMWIAAKPEMRGFMTLLKNIIQDMYHVIAASMSVSAGDFSGAYDHISKVGNHYDNDEPTKKQAQDTINQRKADEAIAKLFPNRARAPIDQAGRPFNLSDIDPSWTRPTMTLPTQDVTTHNKSQARASAAGTIQLGDIVIHNNFGGAHKDASAIGDATYDAAIAAANQQHRDTAAAASGWWGNPKPAADAGATR